MHSFEVSLVYESVDRGTFSMKRDDRGYKPRRDLEQILRP